MKEIIELYRIYRITFAAYPADPYSLNRECIYHNIVTKIIIFGNRKPRLKFTFTTLFRRFLRFFGIV